MGAAVARAGRRPQWRAGRVKARLDRLRRRGDPLVLRLDAEIARLRGDGKGGADDLESDAAISAELERLRPRTRGECEPGGKKHMRPCVFVSCRWNLALRIQPNGTALLNLPGYRESGKGRALNPKKVPGGAGEAARLIDRAADLVHELPETCVLDVADAGEHNFAQIGGLLNIDKERARQIAESGMAAFRAAGVPLAPEDE